MKLHFTFLFSLLFVISAFAQPQKGDFFFGTSSLTFNHASENNNIVGFMPMFGTFVADNTLVGGGISLIGANGDTQTQLAIFANQFIGKGKVKGLTSLQITSVEGIIFSDFQFGVAFFPADNASINLTYRVLPFVTGNGDFETFPNEFRPDIGLSMRFFLLRNREEVEPIIARNSIKKGVQAIGLSGSFVKGRNASTLLINGASKTFIKDNLFIAANLRSLSFFNSSSTRKNSYAIVPQIGAGYYANISEDFALRFDALFSFAATNDVSSFTSEILKTRTKSALVSAGFAIFKGRHKIEPTIGFDFFNISLKDARAETVNAVNFQIKAEYEYFLSKNTSLTGLFTILPVNTTFRPSRFAATGDNQYGFYEFENSPFGFVLGFNYYIMR